ncbi:MAG: hypothetical protein M5U34_20480 [Chloroflexi bacterium]|nr:hypothetical protein [Chloroflexota bacterium]
MRQRRGREAVDSEQGAGGSEGKKIYGVLMTTRRSREKHPLSLTSGSYLWLSPLSLSLSSIFPLQIPAASWGEGDGGNGRLPSKVVVVIDPTA